MRFARGGKDRILRQWNAPRLQKFLQLRFRVFAESAWVARLERVLEKTQHQVVRRIKPSVEEYGADQRFDRIGKNRRPVHPSAFELAFAEQQLSSEVDLQRDLVEAVLVYQARA